MKKSLVLAMAMALGVTASAYAANPFSDVPAGHWAYDSVAKLAAAGVVDGYVDGAFGGDKLMTRYEMAQIVAKAMAKGANVDKLAAEFADELDTLGVRVAKLEKNADAVKISGQVRARYFEGDKANSSNLRTRLWLNGQVNDDWSYTAMIENTHKFSGDESNDENIRFRRAYVEGKIGGVAVQAGQWNECTLTANILDTCIDGAKLSYGKDVKVFGLVGAGDGVGFYMDKEQSDRVYAVGVETKVADVDVYAAYFKADVNEEKEIWNIGASKAFGDFTLKAEYMRGNEEYRGESDKDGWYADLAWKGASAAEPGSYGLHVGYYDQSYNAYISPTCDGWAEYTVDWDADGGYKGWQVGGSYALAKNIVLDVNYFDFEGKKGNVEDEMLFADVYFTF